MRFGWRETVYWCVDLEVSGLDPRKGEILAVGMVPVRGGSIRYGELFYTLVRPETRMGWEGVEAHGLIPADLSAAPRWEEVLEEVDRRVREGVLVVHGAHLDLLFLREAYRRAGWVWPRPPVVDTVRLLQRLDGRLRWLYGEMEENGWELARARRLVGLPSYPRHHAGTDAVATAELFLALVHRLQVRTFRDLRPWGG